MTFTSHRHHIPGSTTDDELDSPVVQPIRCGGPLVCESCQFESRWYEDRDSKRKRIFPSEIESLDSKILRKIATTIRDQNPLEGKGNKIILRRQRTSPIHALADAIDGVADEISRNEY